MDCNGDGDAEEHYGKPYSLYEKNNRAPDPCPKQRNGKYFVTVGHSVLLPVIDNVRSQDSIGGKPPIEPLRASEPAPCSDEQEYRGRQHGQKNTDSSHGEGDTAQDKKQRFLHFIANLLKNGFTYQVFPHVEGHKVIASEWHHK